MYQVYIKKYKKNGKQTIKIVTEKGNLKKIAKRKRNPPRNE